MRRLLAILLLLAAPLGAEVVDRVEVAIGNRVITRSDIEMRIRLTAFQNQQKPDFSLDSRRRTARMLIDHRLIEREMEIGHYPRIGAPPVEELLTAFQKANYPEGHDAMTKALAAYSLTEADLRGDLARQADLLTFLSLRFRPTVDVTDEEVRKYFDEKVLDATQRALGLNGMRAQIAETITSERADRDMDAWLDDQRRRTRIDYPDPEMAGVDK